MRRSMTVFIALAVLSACGVAWAVDTNTLTVSASVTATCKFSSASSTLAFGALDPSVGTDVNGSTTTQFWCTKGVTTDAIIAGNGSNYSAPWRRMAGPGGDLIPYSLTLTVAGTNAGPASPRTLTIAGTVLGTDYTAKSAGSYSDTVALTITP
jgi:spore coat protein U-like protein